MSVSKQERSDYERGVSDSKLGTFDKAVNDITVNHPDSHEYYEGRKGNQLDEDKSK